MRIFVAVVFAYLSLNMGVAQAQELAGFRLEMSLSDAARHASRIGQTMTTFQDDGAKNGWHSVLVTPNGPSLSFCRGKMASITTTDNSHIHEFVSVIEATTRTSGVPDIHTQQSYVGGRQLSSVRLEWQLKDGVIFSVSFNGYAENQTQIARSYFNKGHACR